MTISLAAQNIAHLAAACGGLAVGLGSLYVPSARNPCAVPWRLTISRPNFLRVNAWGLSHLLTWNLLLTLAPLGFVMDLAQGSGLCPVAPSNYPVLFGLCWALGVAAIPFALTPLVGVAIGGLGILDVQIKLPAGRRFLLYFREQYRHRYEELLVQLANREQDRLVGEWSNAGKQAHVNRVYEQIKADIAIKLREPRALFARPFEKKVLFLLMHHGYDRTKQSVEARQITQADLSAWDGQEDRKSDRTARREDTALLQHLASPPP